MECNETWLLSQELLDEALSPSAAYAVRQHLSSCPACARVHQGLTAIARAFAALPVYSLRPETRALILTLWTANRRFERNKTWACAALLAVACSSVAAVLWLLYAGLNVNTGQALLELMLNPGQAEVMLRLAVMNCTMGAARWWSTAEAWLKPMVPGLEGGVLITGMLFTAMVSLFLVIELHNRLRSAPRLGEYI